MRGHGLDRILAAQPLFAGLPTAATALICACAWNVRFQPGQYLFEEGQSADAFYLLRHGRVALELHAPERGSVVFQTLNPGEIVGLSWLLPPYRWGSDARATTLVRATAMDAACLRGKCEADPSLGYELMKRFMPVLVQRLQATRLQILDVYGAHA